MLPEQTTPKFLLEVNAIHSYPAHDVILENKQCARRKQTDVLKTNRTRLHEALPLAMKLHSIDTADKSRK